MRTRGRVGAVSRRWVRRDGRSPSWGHGSQEGVFTERLFLCRAERGPTPSPAPADTPAPHQPAPSRPVRQCRGHLGEGQLGVCPTSPALGIATDGADSKVIAPTPPSPLYRLFSDAPERVGPRGGDDSALSSLG